MYLDMVSKLVLLQLLALCLSNAANLKITKRPNIVLVLTDDQDNRSTKPLRKLQKLVTDRGVKFKNSFVSTPLCCPSRSSLLTGMYQHNTAVLNNTVSGNCSSRSWQHQHEPHTFASILQKSGYRTFYAGKYLNQYGMHNTGGVQHIPVGWDWWAALKGNSRYYNYSLSINGTNKHFTKKYLTEHIHELALDFLRMEPVSGPPFLMFLSPPAPHAPYTPAPKYRNCYPKVKVPRTPNFNPVRQEDKHWMMRLPPWPLPPDVLVRVDEYWRRRWCTLLSVDDMVDDLFSVLRRQGRLKDTFFLFTSDNGYHMGHYGLPWDKRQPYDTDLRVPLVVSGPGVLHRVLHNPVTTVDIAPTIIDMAGLSVPAHMDGLSFFPLLQSEKENHRQRALLVEYSGEGGKSVDPNCPWKDDSGLSNCDLESACKCQDAINNTYICHRSIGPHIDYSFCKFLDGEGFVEAYNLRKDPFQMHNIAFQLSKRDLQKNSKLLKRLSKCTGSKCVI